MSGTHFKGPVQFSNQTPALQNLNIGNWPDQVHVIDDFDQHVFNAGAAAGNFWSVIAAVNCAAAVPTLGNDGSLNGVVNSPAAGAVNDGNLVQGNMNYATPQSEGDRVYFECRTSSNGAVSNAGIFAGSPNTFWGLAEQGAAVGSTFGAAVTSLVGFKLLAGADQVVACIKSPGGEMQFTPNDPDLLLLGTMAQNQFITLGFELTNSPAVVSNNNTKTSIVNFFVNRRLYATCRTISRTGGTPSSQFTAGTSIGPIGSFDAFPATNTAAQRMGLTWDFGLTATGASTLSHDYFMASQDRAVSYSPND